MLGNKAIENEFYHFKDMFNTRARKEETRQGFYGLVKQMHTLRDAILASPQKPDFLEQQGFSYSENTFDDLFVKKFKDILDVSTDSSDDDDLQQEADKDDNDQIDSSSIQIPQNTSGTSENK